MSDYRQNNISGLKANLKNPIRVDALWTCYRGTVASSITKWESFPMFGSREMEYCVV